MNRLFTATPGGRPQNNRPSTEAQLVQQGVIFATEDSQLVMYDGQGNKTWFVDTTAGNVTITLPAANADNAIGVTFTIKRKTAGVNTLTIDPATGNIEGSVTAAMPTQFDFRQYRSDGTEYWRVA